jgi:hypothetical protein
MKRSWVIDFYCSEIRQAKTTKGISLDLFYSHRNKIKAPYYAMGTILPAIVLLMTPRETMMVVPFQGLFWPFYNQMMTRRC